MFTLSGSLERYNSGTVKWRRHTGPGLGKGMEITCSFKVECPQHLKFANWKGSFINWELKETLEPGQAALGEGCSWERNAYVTGRRQCHETRMLILLLQRIEKCYKRKACLHRGQRNGAI